MSPANGSQASTLPQKDGSELSENREPTSCREGPWQAGSTHRVLEEAPGGKEVTRPHPAGRMCLRSPEPRGTMALLPAPHSPAVDLCTCAQLRKPLRPASLSRVSPPGGVPRAMSPAPHLGLHSSAGRAGLQTLLLENCAVAPVCLRDAARTELQGPGQTCGHTDMDTERLGNASFLPAKSWAWGFATTLEAEGGSAQLGRSLSIQRLSNFRAMPLPTPSQSHHPPGDKGSVLNDLKF